MDFVQEVGLLETSRYLFPNWLATSLSESIHLESSPILCLPTVLYKELQIQGP